MTAGNRQSTFTGTKEVAERLRFDVGRLESYLRDCVEGFGGPITVQQFKGGQSNPTYLIETPARRYVLRRKPPGKLLPSAHAVDREHRVMSALHAQGFPVPQPILYCADEAVIGTAFFVMSHVDGRVFWEAEMPSSNPAERAAVYDAMNATLARLTATTRPPSDLPTTAAARTTSPARSSAGPGNTAPRKRKRSTTWSG
jgi:aminoglycoside phosphotransferase (APT) family kinase protein